MNPFIKEKEIEKIVLEHLLRIRKIEEDTCALIRQQVNQLTARLLLIINQNLKNKDYSKKYECLYYLMEDSKKDYQSFIAKVDDYVPLLTDEKTKDIFMGLREVATNAIDNMIEQDDNPIAYERMVMISAGILKIKQYILDCIEDAYVHCNIGNHITKTELVDYMNHQVNDFFSNALTQINELLETTIANLAIREEAMPYIEFMVDQKNQLETLVMVQIDVLEERTASEREAVLIHELVSVLQELYQRTLLVEKKIKDVQEHHVTPVQIIDRETMMVLIEDHLLTRSKEALKLFEAVEENRKEGLDEILERVGDELDKSSKLSFNDIRRKSSQYQLLSCHILELFGKAVDQLSVLELSYDTEDGAKISRGLVDTMRLKHESMKEKDTEYQILKKDLIIKEEKRLLDIQKAFETEAEDMLKKAIDGSNEGFLGLQNKFMKVVSEIEKNQFKQDMTYMRNDLLFELRTFDELVHHSLIKLIELEGDKATPVKKAMKMVYDQSRKILNRSDILFIEPEPHEKFDAKLHEVMLAEEHADYAKGEVIKCHNIGYIKDDFVIVRANVVAAK